MQLGILEESVDSLHILGYSDSGVGDSLSLKGT